MKQDGKGRVFAFLPWIALWLAFLAFGTWFRGEMPWTVAPGLRNDMPFMPEVYGMDYGYYAPYFQRVAEMSVWGVRHPLFNVFILPFTMLGRWIDGISVGAFWVYVIGLFCAVMTGAVCLLGRIMRRIGLSAFEAVLCMALFASFSYAWLLAICPESFGISCLLSLGLLLWGLGSGGRGRGRDALGWGLFAFFMGGVTVSQIAKAALAYAAVHRIGRKAVWTVLGLGALLAVLAAATLVFRHASQMGSLSGVWDVVAMKWSMFSKYFAIDVPMARRLHQYWVFLSEPIAMRGEDVRNATLGCYSGWTAPLAAGAALVCAAAGAWLNRRHVLVKLVGAMFAVDFALHFVLSWGMAEAQIYAGHWFYAVPLLAGGVLLHLRGRSRALYAAFLAILAAAIFACNVHAVFFGSAFQTA